MARYKGRMSPKAIERDFPHVVEIAVPPGGLVRSWMLCTISTVRKASKHV
jgi:hypothetical protein